MYTYRHTDSSLSFSSPTEVASNPGGDACILSNVNSCKITFGLVNAMHSNNQGYSRAPASANGLMCYVLMIWSFTFNHSSQTDEFSQ